MTIDRRRTESAAIPAEVAQALADIDTEFSPKETLVSEKIEELEEQIKKAVLEAGKSVKGGSHHAVFTNGRVTWETKGLDGLIVAFPDLEKFRKVGQPSVSIRKS